MELIEMSTIKAAQEPSKIELGTKENIKIGLCSYSIIEIKGFA